MPNVREPRLIRPDGGLPVILHAGIEPRTVIITSPKSDLVEVHRHYDVNTSTLENCECEPRCGSHRVETFACGVALVEQTSKEEVWEEVLLQITQSTMVEISRYLATKYEVTDTRGAWFQWKRRTRDRNSSVIISWLGRSPNPPNPFDIGWCLLKRRSIPVDFFKRPDLVKPRMPLGQNQKKGG